MAQIISSRGGLQTLIEESWDILIYVDIYVVYLYVAGPGGFEPPF